MRRSVVLVVGLLVPLVLVVLLFGSVLSLASTSGGESSGVASRYSTGVDLPAAGPDLSSWAPDGSRADALDPGILWGREFMSRVEENEAFGTWLTNLPPRPRAEMPLSAARVQASAEQPLSGVPHPSVGSEVQAHLSSATQAVPATAVPSTAEAVGSSVAANEPREASTMITLEFVHRDIESAASSSSFVITNTVASPATCMLEFYWPNDQFVGSQVLMLDPGQALAYSMDSAPIGELSFVGYVVITSDQPIEGRILTPDYGLINGIVYQPDASTPLQIEWVSVNRWSDGLWFGSTYNMSDGQFYLGGLPDGDFAVFVRALYPWASQWYSGKTSREQADPIPISGAGETPIEVVIQQGGRITGTVYASDGVTRLENVNVDVEQAGYGDCSDANGQYVLEGLPFGDYKVVASRGMNFCLGEQATWVVEYYEESFDPDGATVLTLGEGNDTIPDIDFTLDEGGVIEGTVYASDGETPLENVNVQIAEEGYGTCTDVNGHYAIVALPHDDYKVRAGGGWNWCLDQNSEYLVEYYEETSHAEAATILPISPSSLGHDGIDFTLDEGGVIEGTVYASDGETPLENVNVDIEQGGFGTCTNSSGEYTIVGLPHDDYKVRAGGGWNWCLDQNSEYLVEYYEETSDAVAATILPISPSSLSHEGIDFTLDEGGVIEGTVYASDGVTPLENVNVDIEEGGFGTCTNSSGEYTIVGLPYGDYRVRAGGDWNWCLSEPSAYAMEYWEEVYSYQEATLVSVSGTPQGGIDFTMELGGYITGTVSNAEGMPIEGVNVAAVIHWDCPWCARRVASANTDANGDYTLGPLSPLDATVYACASCSGHLYVDEWYGDAWNIQDATFLSITLGTTVPGIDIVLDPGVLVTGTVTVPGGYSAEGIQVDVWQQSEPGYGTVVQTDASGVYRAAVPPIFDDYWKMLVRPWGTDLGSQWLYAFDLSRQTEWDFDLGPGGTIAGTITSGGVPVPDAHVEANSFWLALGSQTDADGNYEIANLLPGEYQIYAGRWPDYIDAYYGGGPSGNWSTPLGLEAGEFLGGVDVDITPLGRLEGTVYESDGTTPIEGVRVVAMNDEGFWEAWTGVDGTFYMDVPAGDYRVRFMPDPWSSRVMAYYGGSHSYATADIVTVPPYFPDENLTTLTMNLEMPATLDGTVRDSSTGDPVAGVMVAVEVRDPAVDRRFSFWSECTDETGQYHIDSIWPGENQVWVAGTCSGNDYGMVTGTFVADPGGHHVLDLEVTVGSVPLPRPFTIRSSNVLDFTPLSSGGLAYVTAADEILPALFTPLVELNDQSEWASELLVQVPTLDNGGAVIDGDQLVVTYELLPGLLWSDGAPLTSSDIRFTWELLTQPSPETDEYVLYADPLWQVEGIDTPDPLTAVVTFRPDYYPPGFEGTIGYLMPEHVLAGEHRVDVRWNSDYAHYPVGNGPYVVIDYMPGSHIDLRANPNYHRHGEGLPEIEAVRFLFTNDPDDALPSGAADVALNVDPTVYAGFDIPTQTRVKSLYRSIVPNTDLPYFEDVRVRRALYYALDRDRYVAGYSAYDVKADAYLPPGHPMFTDTLVRYPFDLDTAASLLDAAGWTDHDANGIRDKDGVEFEFDLNYPDYADDSRQELCLMWQEDLATIDVDVNCVPMEWNDLVQAARRGELEAYTMGWGFDSRVDPMGYYLFHSRSVPSAYNNWSGGPMNRWADPDPGKTDAWLEAARTELDPDSMRGYYADHLARFTDQVPSWVYSHDTRTDAYVPILHNFRPGQATAATWNIEDWTLEPNPYDLAVRKRLAVDSPAPQPDTTITYEIQVHNYGTQPVSNATLVDALPSEVLFVSATPTEVSYIEDTLTWNLGTIPANTSAAPVLVTVGIPNTVTHGTVLTNAVEVYGDEADTHPSNNGFVHIVEVREDVDVAVTKAGVGLAAVGAEYTYLIDYANWGGAPAEGVVLTDTLPVEVDFVSADPPPTADNGLELTWTLPTLLGNQWGGQILVTTEITATGTAVNTAEIGFPGTDADLSNNIDLASEDIDEILAPIITQPTQGTTGGQPLFRGLAPSGSTVELWDLSTGTTSLGSVVAADGTWELPLALAEGSYSIAATATKLGLTSDYSNSATIVVKHDLPLDTNAVSVTASDVDISRGVVEADRRTLGYRTLVIQAEILCGEMPEPRLRVIENGLWNYILLPVSMTEVEAGLWEVTFRLWLSDPSSTYDIWLDWECGLESQSVRLLSVMIDPDGYVYDEALESGGAAIADSLILDAMVTAYVWRPDLEEWEVWPAGSYGQINPQWTDGTTADGILEEGYYSFLTPPGQYQIVVEAPGYQPYQSSVLTVINEPIHHNIPLKPIVGGSGNLAAPANLGGSSKQVDKDSARKGDTLNYDIWLANSGEWDTGSLSLTDAIPASTAYVVGSLSWTGGGSAEYSSTVDAVNWSGVVPARSQVHISFRVRIISDEGVPFDIENFAQVEGPLENLSSLPDLAATTRVDLRSYTVYLPMVLRGD